MVVIIPYYTTVLKTHRWLKTLKGTEANTITVQLHGLYPIFVAAAQLNEVLPL